jgi:hypothetical protein
MADLADGYSCMFCGESIERTGVDPCVALLTARWLDKGFEESPGQYWFHEQCLRRVTHPSVPLYFLDLADDA